MNSLTKLSNEFNKYSDSRMKAVDSLVAETGELIETFESLQAYSVEAAGIMEALIPQIQKVEQFYKALSV